MAFLLWAVMLTLSAAAWLVQRPQRPTGVRVALAILQGGFIAWAGMTQFDLVGMAWLLVALALVVAVSFRADPVRVFHGSSES